MSDVRVDPDMFFPWLLDQARTEVTRLRAEVERLQAVNTVLSETGDTLADALIAANSVMWMAGDYAEGGGSSGPEMRDYLDAKRRIEAALEKALGPRG